MTEQMMIFWAIVALVGAAFIVGMYYAIPYLKQQKSWEAIKPYATAAIMEAFRASDKAVKYGLNRLEGVQKKALAVYLYKSLPEVKIFGMMVDPKDFITEDQWADLVQGLFDELVELLAEGREDMHVQFEEWLGTI